MNNKYKNIKPMFYGLKQKGLGVKFNPTDIINSLTEDKIKNI